MGNLTDEVCKITGTEFGCMENVGRGDDEDRAVFIRRIWVILLTRWADAVGEEGIKYASWGNDDWDCG